MSSAVITMRSHPGHSPTPTTTTSGRPTSSAHMRVPSVSKQGLPRLDDVRHRDNRRAPVPRPGPLPADHPTIRSDAPHWYLGSTSLILRPLPILLAAATLVAYGSQPPQHPESNPARASEYQPGPRRRRADPRRHAHRRGMGRRRKRAASRRRAHRRGMGPPVVVPPLAEAVLRLCTVQRRVMRPPDPAFAAVLNEVPA